MIVGFNIFKINVLFLRKQKQTKNKTKKQKKKLEK
jgi:hypothetical protein